MTVLHTSDVIVLKVWDYGDKDQIISFLSRDHGKLRAIAKGSKASRKRFSGAVDLFCLSSFTFREKKTHSLHLLEQAKLLSGFMGLRVDYSLICTAMGLLEVTFRLCPDGEKDFPVFDYLHSALHYLSENSFLQKEIFFWFLLTTLIQLGLFPSMDSCVSCKSDSQNWDKGFYHPETAKLFCEACVPKSSQHIPLSMSMLNRMNLKEIGSLFLFQNSIDEKYFKEIMDAHLRHHLGWQFEWERFCV
jgi:DNA repair protein RecO (recombination protein O)